MAVRSRRMASGASILRENFVILYTVPAGRTAIIKACVLTNNTATARTTRLLVRTAGIASDVAVAYPLASRAHLALPWQELVLGPGDTLEAWHAAADTSNAMHFYVSGSLLLGAPA